MDLWIVGKLLFYSEKPCNHIKTTSKTFFREVYVLYIYSLFSAVANLEAENTLLQPYLSLCLQKFKATPEWI